MWRLVRLRLPGRRPRTRKSGRRFPSIQPRALLFSRRVRRKQRLTPFPLYIPAPTLLRRHLQLFRNPLRALVIHRKPARIQNLLRSRPIRRNRIKHPAQKLDFLFRHPLPFKMFPLLAFVVRAVVIRKTTTVVIIERPEPEIMRYGSLDTPFLLALRPVSLQEFVVETVFGE